MKDAVAIRHVAFEDLGSFEEILWQQGFTVRYVDAGVDNLQSASLKEASLLVVLGEPISVNQQEAYPFITDEIALIRQRIEQGKAVLGVCLGAQMIAKALGASVYKAEAKELGFKPLQISPVGMSSPIRHLHTMPVLHWHGETFDLPDGALLLASTDICPHQAFAYGAHVLAIQFHPEVTTTGLERWLIGHTEEIHTTTGASVSALRAAAAVHSPGLQQATEEMLGEWLAVVR